MQQVSIKGQVLAYVERKGGSIDSASLSVLTKARYLAEKISCGLVAVVLGQPGDAVAIGVLTQKGVDEIIAVEHSELGQYNPELFPKILARLVNAEQPRTFLVPHTVQGIEIACSVAGRLGIAPITNCIDIEPADGTFLVTRPMFGGTRHVKITVEGSPVIGTLQSRAWPAQSLGEKEPAVRRYDPSAAGDLLTRIRVLSTIEPNRGEVDITKADVIVSVGRGIGTKANIPLYQELAEVVGGVLACSRPLADLGWLPTEHLVGISGSTVRPKVYLACGISGAYQHIAAMQDSGTIIAINSDPAAPIFEVAHYGAVADLNQLIPSLIELAKATHYNSCA